MHDTSPLTIYAALVVLLIVSAFFSITETSMMALNRYRLKHLAYRGVRGARRTSQLLGNVDKFLGMVLLGNNVLNAACALLVGEIARRHFGDSEMALFVATGAAAFAIVVFAEITPKIVGATYPERIALPSSYVLAPLLTLLRPVIWFVNLFTHGLLWIMRFKRLGRGEQRLTIEELRTLVLEAGNYIPKKHQSILLNLFELESITVDHVMAPRAQIEALDIDAPPEVLRQQIATAYHRRLPLYEGATDDIIGIVDVRTVLTRLHDEALTAARLRAIMRAPYFIPSGTPLFTQLQHFQEHRDRLGLVVDEYGELMGLVTLEDILEEMVGEFSPYSPLQSPQFHLQSDGSYLVEGGSLLRELNRKLGYRFPLDGPKTLNGLIIEHLQEIPPPDTSVRIAGHLLKIVQTQDRVVKVVRLAPPLADSEPA
jgi:Mg2+/Co2+ transporter CorB